MSQPHRRRFQLPWRSAARIQADVDEELRFELDMRERELTERGVPAAEARRRALAEFGDLEATRRYCAALDREAHEEHRRAEWLAELRHDARQTWRGLRRTPGFALVVLLTLALGIGANTAVFSVVRRVLLERLPYREPERLLRLYGATAATPDDRGMLTAAEIDAMQDAVRAPRRSLAAVAPFGMAGGYTYVGDRETEMWQGMAVGPTFFRTLGTSAMLGRTLDERDLAPDAPRAVLLGHALWQRTFGGDSAVVGRTVQLDGQPHVVVGVMSPAFVSPTFVADAWTPLDLAPFVRGRGPGRGMRIFRAVARLADGATLDGARAELAVLARRADERADAPHGAARDERRVHAVPLRTAMVGEARPVLLVVMGAAALVLVVACVNVAGLFLARATARRREIAVRAALGAGRRRIVRQLLTESALVGLAGGALGVALAYWGKALLVRVGERVIPAVGPIRIDGGVLAFAVVVSLASGVLFGLVPALLGTRADVGSALAEGSRGAAGGRVRARAGRLLVAGQVALAVVLLVGAGLLGRTLVALERVGVGHATDAHVLTFRVNLVRSRYPDRESRAAFFDALLERLRAMPGVRATGLVGISPWNGWNHEPFAIDARTEPAGGAPVAAYASVSEGFLAALAIPVRAGRAFGAGDRATSPPVALVSEGLARQHWPGGSPLGARIRVGAPDAPWREIVGVVGDVRASASSDPDPVVYVPASQAPSGGNELVVRTAGDAAALLPAVRGALRELDPALPLVMPRTMDAVFRDTLAGQRLPMLFTTAFATLALVLAALGVYGVTAYAVAARTREFGIRAALGARRAGVLWLVLRQGLGTALVGVAAGLAAAAAASRVLAGLLVGVGAHDAVTFVATPVVLLVVAAAACLVPARRATRSDPAGILRAD